MPSIIEQETKKSFTIYTARLEKISTNILIMRTDIQRLSILWICHVSLKKKRLQEMSKTMKSIVLGFDTSTFAAHYESRCERQTSVTILLIPHKERNILRVLKNSV